MLDETGALSIIWDCMMEGAEKEQSFKKTYNHIVDYSAKTIAINPMVSKRARMFWNEKQCLTQEFVKQLAFDIGIDD